MMALFALPSVNVERVVPINDNVEVHCKRATAAK